MQATPKQDLVALPTNWLADFDERKTSVMLNRTWQTEG